MSDIPLAERKNALDIRIQQWSPFKETERYVVWNKESKEMAQVWIWDKAARFSAMNSLRVNISRIFPEPVLYPPPKPEIEPIIRILSCTEGIEAQIWREGILFASHYWHKDISPKEWSRFLLAHDLDPSIKMPEPEAIPMLNQPWGKSSDNYSQFQIPKAAFQVTTAVLIFFLIWQGVGIWRWYQGEKILNEQISGLAQNAEPLLNARSRAIEYKNNIEKLLSLNTYPPQLNLMAVIADNLSENIRLSEWHYNQGNLTFTLKGIYSEQEKNLDPRYYVETYQKIPYFKDVSAEKGVRPDELVIKMSINNSPYAFSRQ